MIRSQALMVLLALTLAASFATAAAQPLVPGLRTRSGGAFEYAGLSFSIIHFDPNWTMRTQVRDARIDDGFPRQSARVLEHRGQFTTAGGAFGFQQMMRSLDQSGVSYEAKLTSAEGVRTNTLALLLTLPTDGYAGTHLLLDGKPVVLPAQLKEMGVLPTTKGKRLSIPAATGHLLIESPQLSVSIQDDRKFNSPAFGVRIFFTPSDGLVKQAALEMSIRQVPFEVSTIDIAKQANMAWTDETEGDRKGGWTDQGANNDLRMLPPGRRPFGPILCDILDPAKNDGKACIVLAGAQREYFPKSVTIPTDGKPLPNVYLLHATAWTPTAGTPPVGTIRATYADGTETIREVQANREAGDWWAPMPLGNGAIVWTAENKSAFVGLYLSRFQFGDKPVKSLTLTSSGGPVWMIAAISASNDPIALPAESPVFIVAGGRWKAIQQAQDVQPGSILDFSGFIDVPAGKHGHLVVKGPHFEFANRPGQRVRFYGTNLCFSANFPDKAEAEKLADRIARIGYNCVRIHHYDYDLTDKKAKDSVTLDAAQFDKLEYFIHCLKNRGLYINIDLYTIRESRAHEIPEINRPVRLSGYKALVPLLDSAMGNWQQFARNVLTHRNPYTGMTLAEDPVLTGICPLNEDTLMANIGDADVRKLYDERFERWLKEQKLTPASADERGRLMHRFLTELQADANRRVFSFLKGLGVRAPLTSVNFITNIPLTVVRQELEFVDNHSYWDHPGFPEQQWSMPFSYGNKSATAAAASVPRGMFASRIVGKPFTVTEINYCFPNRFRAEGGPLMGAYASLQNWDGLFRFAYSHNIGNTRQAEPARGFDLVNEPLSLLSERIGILLFLRGDVAPARRIIPYLVTPDTAYTAPPVWGRADFPQELGLLGLHTGVGSIFQKAGAAAGNEAFQEALRAADAAGLQARRMTSDTGQIALDAGNGTLRVITGRSECFVIQDAGELAGQAVSMKNAGGFAVVSVSAMDGKPLASSNRLLIIHLTDLQNTKTKYRNQTMTLLEQWGQLPLLVRAGRVQVSLKLDGNRAAKLWPIDLAGKRGDAIDLTRDDGTLHFTADTGRSVMAYELVRE